MDVLLVETSDRLVAESGDGIALEQQAWLQSAADAISMGDATATGSGHAWSQSASDTMTMGEGESTAAGFHASPADAMSMSEYVAGAAAFSSAFTDAMTVSEAVLNAIGYQRTYADALSVGENVTANILMPTSVSISNTLSMTDNLMLYPSYYRPYKIPAGYERGPVGDGRPRAELSERSRLYWKP